MVLDGRSIIDKKYVTFNDDFELDYEDQVQPNGVDLRADKIYEVTVSAEVPREGKAEANGHAAELDPKEGWWQLKKDRIYYVDFLEAIWVPGGYCATLITRSSLVRAGVDVMAGLWDSGFTGNLGCTLRVHSPISIEWGAKLCQVMFWQAKFNGHLYEGRYQNSNSQTALTT